MNNQPFVSIVIPCRNEEVCIVQCLDSIIANDYEKDRLEILVVDGRSEDGTREIVERLAQRYPFIRLLDNPKKITPVALNIGITKATGDIIMRVDAHARLKKDYILRCVESLNKYGADNVGGIMKTLPQGGGLLGEAIVLSLSHRFGVGNSYFRTHTSTPKWVDTVFGGCYRNDVFQKVGLFNEALARGQDIEFNLRLKKAGGRTLLVPDIVTYYYYARSDLRSFWKHSWTNGVWAILPFLYSPIMPVAWRHLVPLAYVFGLLGSVTLGLLWPPFLWLWLAIVTVYGLASLAASFQIAWRERGPRYLAVMPLAFAMLHFAYGLGSVWGVVKAARHMVVTFFRKKKQLGAVVP